MEKKKRPKKPKTARSAAKKTKAPATEKETVFPSAVGIYVFLVVLGFVLITVFHIGFPGSRPSAVKSTPAVIAPASVSVPAPRRAAPPTPAPMPSARQDEAAALESSAPARELWTWRYEEGVTGLSKPTLQQLQEVAAALKENPRLQARVQVGASSSTSQADAMAAERAALVVRTLQEQGVAPNQLLIDNQGNGQPRQGSVILERR